MRSLPISHRRQQQQADCLAACAAMVLDYLGVSVAYPRLLQLLRIRSYGASFSNLRHLSTLGLTVQILEGDFEQLRSCIDAGFPPLVAVSTGMLSYWHEDTDHVVVVCGIDDESVFVHDPDRETGPQAVSHLEFEAAWIEHDYRFAIISSSSGEQ